MEKACRGVPERKARDSELCFLNHWPNGMIEEIFLRQNRIQANDVKSQIPHLVVLQLSTCKFYFLFTF